MPDMSQEEYVRNFTDQTRHISEEWHNKIKEWRRLYDQDHYNSLPKPSEVQYTDPSYTNTVDLAIGVLLGNNIDWRANGWTSSPKEEIDSGRIEKYLAGTLDVNSERNEYYIPYELLLNFVRDGCGVLYSCWDPLRAKRSLKTMPMPDEDGNIVNRQVYVETPILAQVMDPLSIYLLPGGEGRWSKIMREEMWTIADVEAHYGLKLKRYAGYDDFQKTTTKVKVIDFWEFVPVPSSLPDSRWEQWYASRPTAVQNAVLCEDEFLRPLRLMPGYDDLPYTVGFFKPVDRNSGKDWGHGILPPMESSVAMLERAINRRQRQIDVYSNLPVVSRTRDGRDVSVDPGLGTHVALTLEEDIGFPVWHGAPPDVDHQMGFMQGRTEQSSFPEIMYGNSQSRMAGYAISMLTDQARIRLTQPTIHLEQMLTRWGRKVLRLTQNMASKSLVRVYGRMRGKDFAEQVDGELLSAGYTVKAVVKPVFPNEAARNVAMATQTAGILTRRTIMEKYLGIEQPEDEDRRRLQEQVKSHPLVMQYALMTAMKELADEGDPAAAMALQSLIQQGMTNQGGRPNEPNAMQQFTGTPSPTGQMTSQEQGGMPPGQSAEDQMGQMAGASPQLLGGVE